MEKKVTVADEQQKTERESFRLIIDREAFSKTKKEKEELRLAKSLWKKSQKQTKP